MLSLLEISGALEVKEIQGLPQNLTGNRMRLLQLVRLQETRILSYSSMVKMEEYEREILMGMIRILQEGKALECFR